MEYLLELLNKVQQVSPLPIFEKEVIVVQNAGMQHWLNMSVANTRGISMNIDYALPAQFLWKLARSVASKEVVPDQSPYSREVLSWRIYRLLQTEQVLKDTDFATVVSYFSSSAQAKTTPEQSKQVANIDDLKQSYLKSCQLMGAFVLPALLIASLNSVTDIVKLFLSVFPNPIGVVKSELVAISIV